MNFNISKLYSKYKGMWISITNDYSRVLASSKDFDELVKEINEKKMKKGLIMKIPSKRYSAYVG